MPRKKRAGGRRAKGGRRVHRRRVGGSRFTDFFTKTIPNAAKTVYNKALKPAGNFIKNNHLLSTVAALIPHPAGKVGAAGLRAVGLGRRRRVRRKAVGGSRTMMGARRRMHGGLSALNGRLYLI
jgi:hypothetical protein